MTKKYTNQSAFDAVWKHFVVDGGKPSMSSEGVCLYRGRGGAKCALGVLIPDEVMDPLLLSDRAANCESSEGLFARHPEVSDLFEDDAGPFISRLQGCHDASVSEVTSGYGYGSFTELVTKKLRNLASQYDLRIPAS